jgi:hypothetical protein
MTQEDNNKEKASFGFQLNEFQQDFGIGINLTSPAIMENTIELHLRGNMMFQQYYDTKSEESTWQPYANIMIGISSATYKINSNVALYGEGGGILILPSSTIDEDATEFGGYGIFGFEFMFADSFSYFLEAGAVGTGASAEKIPGRPIYSNGFILSVGWKINL